MKQGASSHLLPVRCVTMGEAVVRSLGARSVDAEVMGVGGIVVGAARAACMVPRHIICTIEEASVQRRGQESAPAERPTRLKVCRHWRYGEGGV